MRSKAQNQVQLNPASQAQNQRCASGNRRKGIQGENRDKETEAL